jgi:hypothetical protein
MLLRWVCLIPDSSKMVSHSEIESEPAPMPGSWGLALLLFGSIGKGGDVTSKTGVEEKKSLKFGFATGRYLLQ